MPTLLFVNACPRGEASRTLTLTRAFLEDVLRCDPSIRVVTHDLTRMNLLPIDAKTLARKEALCDREAWDDPLLSDALTFARADGVIVAAPYWDLSFPSILKVWVEHMYVRNLTFRYENDRPIGLCRGRAAAYITTAGSPIGENDWGAGYMQAVLNMLGIPAFTRLTAEGFDLAGNDPQTLLADAMEQAKRLAPEWVKLLNV